MTDVSRTEESARIKELLIDITVSNCWLPCFSPLFRRWNTAESTGQKLIPISAYEATVTNQLEDIFKERETDLYISNLTSSLSNTGDGGLKTESVQSLKVAPEELRI